MALFHSRNKGKCPKPSNSQLQPHHLPVNVCALGPAFDMIRMSKGLFTQRKGEHERECEQSIYSTSAHARLHFLTFFHLYRTILLASSSYPLNGK